MQLWLSVAAFEQVVLEEGNSVFSENVVAKVIFPFLCKALNSIPGDSGYFRKTALSEIGYSVFKNAHLYTIYISLDFYPKIQWHLF